jgi:predicted RNA-binding protein
MTDKLKKIARKYERHTSVQFLYYGYPYGVIPIELQEFYPLGQTNRSFPIDENSKKFISKIIKKYLFISQYQKIIFIYEPSLITEKLMEFINQFPNVFLINLYLPNSIDKIINQIIVNLK